MRQGFSSVRIKFSIATNNMDNAMIGSTTAGGATMMFFMLNARVIECATVNAVACHRIVFIRVLSKQSPATKRI